jgi:hypothetical protein
VSLFTLKVRKEADEDCRCRFRNLHRRERKEGRCSHFTEGSSINKLNDWRYLIEKKKNEKREGKVESVWPATTP